MDVQLTKLANRYWGSVGSHAKIYAEGSHKWEKSMYWIFIMFKGERKKSQNMKQTGWSDYGWIWILFGIMPLGGWFYLPKEIESVHSKGDQSWVFFGRKDAEAETPALWPPHVKSWLIGKDSDAGRDWGQEEKGTTEDEMASLTRWTWVWVNSGSWWWTGRPGVLRFRGSQRVRHDWATELNWTELKHEDSR